MIEYENREISSGSAAWDAPGFHMCCHQPKRLLKNTDWKYKVPHAPHTANSRGYGVAATEPFPKKVNVPCFHIFKDEKVTPPFTILL